MHWTRPSVLRFALVVALIILIGTITYVALKLFYEGVFDRAAAFAGIVLSAISAIIAVFQWLLPVGNANPDERTGALSVSMRSNLRGSCVSCRKVSIFPQKSCMASVIEEVSDGHTIYVARFPNLSPGCYLVHSISGHLKTKITVNAGQEEKIQWR